MPHRTFGVEEVAQYLHLQRAEVERLVKDKEIPFERHGARIVFRKVEIDSWVSPRILGLEGRRLTEYHQKTSLRVRENLATEVILPEVISPEFVEPALQAKTKASVLREMVKLAEATGRVWDSKALLTGLEEREEICSTGLPGGMALLHARAQEAYVFESQFVVLGRTVQQVPFGAPDGRATDLFFLIASPDNSIHLHLLARLCLLAQKTDLLEGLRSAAGATEMFDRLIAAERSVLAKAG